MKKTAIALAAFFAVQFANAFAAPINDLAQGQTAAGIGSDSVYLEHKLTNNFTLGYQNLDNDRGDADDLYGQFQLSGNLKGIVGNRSFHSDSNTYLGLAVNSPLSNDTTGYASLIAGSEFKELQVGANFRLTGNIDLNLDYHSFMPDSGQDKNGVGVGATFKF